MTTEIKPRPGMLGKCSTTELFFPVWGIVLNCDHHWVTYWHEWPGARNAKYPMTCGSGPLKGK